MMDFCVAQGLLPKPGASLPEPDYPFEDLAEATPCRLVVPFGRAKTTIEAAHAIALPGRTYNEEAIQPDFAKVQPQSVNPGFETYGLDIPTPYGIELLWDALDLVILWHKRDIVFGTATDKSPKPPKPP